MIEKDPDVEEVKDAAEVVPRFDDDESFDLNECMKYH